jgi:hypothetical protein
MIWLRWFDSIPRYSEHGTMSTLAPVRKKVYVVAEGDTAGTYTCEAAIGTPLAEAAWSIVKTDSVGSNAYPVVGGKIVTGRKLVAADYATYTYTALDE